jgi:hypothetical protein
MFLTLPKLTYNGNEVPDRYVDDKPPPLLRPSTNPMAYCTANDELVPKATIHGKYATVEGSSK